VSEPRPELLALRELLSSAAHEGWRKSYQKANRHDRDWLDVPYDQLTEEWKDYDRSTIDNLMPGLAEFIAAREQRVRELVEQVQNLADECKSRWSAFGGEKVDGVNFRVATAYGWCGNELQELAKRLKAALEGK
jgi:hypothetical protein